MRVVRAVKATQARCAPLRNAAQRLIWCAYGKKIAAATEKKVVAIYSITA